MLFLWSATFNPPVEPSRDPHAGCSVIDRRLNQSVLLPDAASHCRMLSWEALWSWPAVWCYATPSAISYLWKVLQTTRLRNARISVESPTRWTQSGRMRDVRSVLVTQLESTAATLLLYLWVLAKWNARNYSTRRPAPIRWWRERIQKRLVLSNNGWCNVLLVGPWLPARGVPGPPRPGLILLWPLTVYDCNPTCS